MIVSGAAVSAKCVVPLDIDYGAIVWSNNGPRGFTPLILVRIQLKMKVGEKRSRIFYSLRWMHRLTECRGSVATTATPSSPVPTKAFIFRQYKSLCLPPLSQRDDTQRIC